jgi:hypothetical protein
MKIKTSTQRNWSRFWLDDAYDFDNDQSRSSGVDYTKLAATQRAIGNFVNIVTGKQIPVVFQSNDRSYTDGTTVTIGTKLDGDNFDPAVGLALHEGSHIAYTDFTLLKDVNGNSTGSLAQTKMATVVRMQGCDPDLNMTEQQFDVIKNILNWIEDRRIDYKVYTNAPGYRVYYQSMYDKYFNDTIIDKALKENAKSEETWDDYIFHIINFTNPNRNLNALKKLREIWNVIDLKNINRLTDTTDALQVSCQVYKLIAQAVAEEPANVTDSNEGDESSGEQGEQGEGSGAGSTGENDMTDFSDGEGDADEESDNESSGNGSGNASSLSDKQLEKLEKAIKAQKEFLEGQQSKKGRLSKSQTSIINAIKESGTEIRQVFTDESNTNPIETVVVKKLTPSIICSLPELFQYSSESVINGKEISKSSQERFTKSQNAVQRGISLGRSLGNKLQLRNADRTLKSTRLQTGKIDRRLVSQLGYDNVNVFHRIVTERYKNYFLHISIDASGSMDGTKFHNAITSAVAIAQAASMTTGIRVQISLRGTATLNSNVEKCVTVIAYDSATDKMSKIINNFKYLATFGCTPEGLSFKSIEKDIKAAAKGDELILINYSDGAPTSVARCHTGYNGVEYTRRVVNELRANGMQIISYFIKENGWYSSSDHDSFQKMYGQDAQFIDPVNMLQVSKTMNAKFLEKVQ